MRRPRPGSLERPVSTRIYRAAWMLAAVPVLVAAFTVARPETLPAPRLEPSFDRTTAVGFATELARRFPDRSPGSTGARGAAAWVAARFRDYGLKAEPQTFGAELPELGQTRLVNLAAVVPGRSPETIVVMAHRDNLGRAAGADDNASGTGALLELVRDLRPTPLAHTLVFLSTDAGAYGAVGAAEFAAHPEFLKQMIGGGAAVAAVINLDALTGSGSPRLVIAGDAPRSPAPALVATADDGIAAETRSDVRRPGALAQLIDLAFPFSLHEQAPFVAHRASAVTITTGGERAPAPEADTLEAFRPHRLGALGRAAQRLITAVDESADVARSTRAHLYLRSRALPGWTVEFFFLVALAPFAAATVDLFARCRRRRVSLARALRSLASRLGVWLWAGAVLALFATLGALTEGDARPLPPELGVAEDWPVAALVGIGILSALAWLVARPRLVPRRPIPREDDLAGHLAAMLALAIVALVVAGANPYALLFVLPSMHAWLWLPHVSERNLAWRLGLYAAGFAGPLLLVGSFAVRFGLGLDAPWYVVALAAAGYVQPPLILAALAWAAIAGQVGALVFGRYAPYPSAADRPRRGPIRATIRAVVLFAEARRARDAAAEPGGEIHSLGE